MDVHPADARPHRVLQGLLCLGCLCAMLLIVVALVRYPGNAATMNGYRLLGAVSLLILLGSGGWTLWRGWRAADIDMSLVLRLGIIGGFILGLLWVIEISFNNFVPPDISTGAARGIVDNVFWAIIAIGILGLSAMGAYRTRRVWPGIRIGAWSGFVSGLVACLMGLLLVVIWMRFLLRDPLAISEWDALGAANGAPDMATYLAYETMTGAIGHLTVLGVAMGVLLGLIGSLIGWGAAWLKRRAPWAGGRTAS